MQLFCIGHKPPEFRLDHSFTFVTPAPVAHLPCLHVPDDHYGDAFDGHITAEYVQLRALADHLEREGVDDDLYIFQYRRFLALQEPPRRSTNLRFAFAVRPPEVPMLFPSRRELKELASHRLVGPRFAVSSPGEHYAVFHHGEDFAAFVAALSEVDGFDVARRRRFEACTQHFPAPSVGILPAQLFIAQMRTLTEAWLAFHARSFVPREGRQRRVGGFLLERLHSFLITEELAQEREAFHAHLCIVSETDKIAATV